MSIAYEPRPAIDSRPSVRGEPTWELALKHPRQGDWTEADYLRLEQQGNLIELVNGCLEFLPMPTPLHQLILQYLYEVLVAHARQGPAGHVLTAPCPLRLWPGRIREPDLFYLPPGTLQDSTQTPSSADLVVEIVSEGSRNRQRDLTDKRSDYALAGVKEYWIVDPESSTVTVLTLNGDSFIIHGEFAAGAVVTSVLFVGLAVSVADIFRVGRG